MRVLLETRLDLTFFEVFARFAGGTLAVALAVIMCADPFMVVPLGMKLSWTVWCVCASLCECCW
jgi:hypothetical protein